MKPLPPAIDTQLIDGLATGLVLNVEAHSQQLVKSVHQHPHGELFLLRSGYVKSQSDDGYWLIPAGHVCWIPPYSAHGADMEFVQGTRIHLAASRCTLMPARMGIFACNPLITAVIDRLASEPSTRAELSAREDLLLQVLLDEIRCAPSTAILLPMPKTPSLKRLAEHWMQQPNDPAGLDQLANDAGLSRRSLSRHFKLETGLSVGQWRQIARLICGFKMLIEGKSVTETAFSLGYDSTTSFVLLCQRHTGMSPKWLGRMAEPAAHR